MPSATLDRVLEQVRRLTPEELKELRDLLERESVIQPSDSMEDAFEQELLAEGILTEAKPPAVDPALYQGRKPFPTTGKPASEIILEERR